MLLTEALKRFEVSKENLTPQTMHTYRSAMKALALEGMTSTKHLTRGRIAAWLAKRVANGLAITTVNTQYAAVLAVCSHLERLELFPLQRLHQLRRLRLRNDPAEAPVFLTRDELARLHVAALTVNTRLELAMRLALFGGLRLTELRMLDREDCHLEVEQPYIYVKKDGHGRGFARTVPIARAFALYLLERMPASGAVLPPMHPNNPGSHVSKGTLQAWLRAARDRAQLFHVTWFTLRHTYGSYLRQGGVELSKLCGWMGNTVRVCERFYAALAPGGDPQVEKLFATNVEASPSVEAPAAATSAWTPRLLRREGAAQ
jgi:integrase